MTLQAQSDKKFLLRADFGYHYEHDDGLDNVPSVYSSAIFGEITREINVNIDGGLKLRSNFYYGLGLSYHSGKKETNPDEDLPNSNNASSGYTTYYSYIQSVKTNNTVSPYVYFQYFKPTTDWLTFSVDVFIKYDFARIKTTNNSYSNGIINVDSLWNGYPDRPFGDITVDGSQYTSGSDVSTQAFHLGIRPSLRFNVLKNAGITFTFGQALYSAKTKDSRASSDENKTKSFDIDISPSNWLLGVFVRL